MIHVSTYLEMSYHKISQIWTTKSLLREMHTAATLSTAVWNLWYEPFCGTQLWCCVMYTSKVTGLQIWHLVRFGHSPCVLHYNRVLPFTLTQIYTSPFTKSVIHTTETCFVEIPKLISTKNKSNNQATYSMEFLCVIFLTVHSPMEK